MRRIASLILAQGNLATFEIDAQWVSRKSNKRASILLQFCILQNYIRKIDNENVKGIKERYLCNSQSTEINKSKHFANISAIKLHTHSA